MSVLPDTDNAGIILPDGFSALVVAEKLGSGRHIAVKSNGDIYLALRSLNNCYYDQFRKQKMLAPEYGGDAKTTGRCTDAKDPIMAFPGHLAPNDLLFYTGNMFPEKYRNGAFIAFHGSWNRSPMEQKGFFVAFVPFNNGLPSGEMEIFADGFAGVKVVKNPNDAAHRPMGLAQGPDGSLYVSDSGEGSIWRIIYTKK